MNVTSTGYFGIPGKTGGLVHAVFNGAPICGQSLRSESVYQWCSNVLDISYLECKKCKKIVLGHRAGLISIMVTGQVYRLMTGGLVEVVKATDKAVWYKNVKLMRAPALVKKTTKADFLALTEKVR